MDQTELFRATVKALRLRIKTQGKVDGSSSDASAPPSSSLLLSRPIRKPTHFASEATEVVGSISKLQVFLLQHRKDYINSAGHLTAEGCGLTDSERDQIDSTAQEYIKVCSERIKTLQQEVAATDVGEQTRQYRLAVHESLKEYLKRVCKLYSEQRAIRVKRIVDRKRISRLQPEGYKRLLLSAGPAATASSSVTAHSSDHTHTTPTDHTPSTTTSSGEAVTNNVGGDGNITEGAAATVDTPHQPPDNTGSEDPPPDDLLSLHVSPPLSIQSTDIRYGDGGAYLSGDSAYEDLTVEERTEFEQENEQLLEHVSTMVDEVRQIEGKVLEISRLQQIITENVLEQAKELDIISDRTVEASENVVGGNEHVRQAIKNKASLRVWILFILIVCSFSLLFLDWYS